MSLADTITGWVDSNGQAVLIDELCVGYIQPEDDRLLGGQDNLYNISGEYSGGYTTLQFSRALVTDDPNDYWIGPGDVYLIWALGSSPG